MIFPAAAWRWASWIGWLVLLKAAAVADSASPPPLIASDRKAALAAQGRHVFERNCVVCHGRWGDGRGEMARGMQPKPRRFTSGIFKYRSTPSGFLPTDSDLERTIRNGVGGTSMPAFGGLLNGRDIEAVIETVKAFSSKWDHAENHSLPLILPPAPEWLEEATEMRRHAALGAPVFQVNCAPCHGVVGRGDGPAAANLEDDWGQPTPPADLTAPSLRGGPAAEDIYRTLVTGLNGTAMPSFLETTTPEDRWNLIAWILSARRDRTSSTNARAGAER